MAVKLSPIGNDAPFLDSSGNPLSGGLLYFFTAGSSTPENTYTTSAGSVANAHPIVLDSGGYPASAGSVISIWLTAGVSYKAVLKTSAGVTVWSRDNITGINDSTSSIDQWIPGPAPTYISATSFSLVGDQTSTFHVDRRLKTTNTAGTVYSTITATAYGSVTTVTVANDSGTLDSGLSAVSYGLVSATNTSINADMINRKGTAVASAATCNIWGIAGDYVHVTGNTGPITSFGTAPYAGAERTVIFDSTPTLTHNATTLILPGGRNIVAAAGDRAVIRADTTANMNVVSYVRASGVNPATSGFEAFTGNGTFTTPANTLATSLFKFTITGGGGSGASSAATGASGSGGGAGATAVYIVTGLTASLACSVVIGAGGAAPSAGANNGNNGANSTVTVSATTVTAAGGAGGNSSGSASAANGANGGSATNGTINITGGMGNVGGFYLSTKIPEGGFGGPSYWGGGGAGGPSGNNGQTGSAYGSGGGGAGGDASSNFAGGAGKAGVLLVEYII